jgi:hypothetical protein
MHNPTHQLPANDSGAETIRNFRFQFVYGIVLLTGSLVQRLDYRAVWCEQEDDLLAEIDDHLFDSYQVKSRKREDGPWQIRDEAFRKSIALFVTLDEKYPGSIRWFNFVSNALLLKTDEKKNQHKCPELLRDAARDCTTPASLDKVAAKGLEQLAKDTQCSSERILAVLKRLRFATAPDREAGFAELVSTHLPQLDVCAGLTVRRVRRLARELLAMIEDASALASQDPARHYAFIERGQRDDPQLRAKRVDVAEFHQRIRQMSASGFRYTPQLSQSAFARQDRKFRRFLAKLDRGGLSHYADTLRNQATSTEALLFDLATRPDGHLDVEHLRQLVKAECDMAHLRHSASEGLFGTAMLRDLDLKFEQLASGTSSNVCGQPKEVLFGTAGMLTDDCEVWWSPKFNADEGS